MRPLIVIPVRGGSVGIPRKALTPLGGISPLARVITTCRELGTVTVVTDDTEVAHVGLRHGADIAFEIEPNHDGLRTVDRAVWQVVEWAPASQPVLTVQCTSPFLTKGTLHQCLDLVNAGVANTAITVRDDRHVAWTGSLQAPTLTTGWQVRQSLPERWVLTGGCIATTRKHMSQQRRFGGLIQLVEVSGAEAVDLDVPADWALAEWYSGAPSLREILMGKVLGEVPQWRGLVVQLSAWGESPEEHGYRGIAPPLVSGRVVPVRGAHTYEEAQLAIDHLKPGEESLTIVTSAYHQVRAFLTFLKVLRDRGLERTVRLYNAPAPSRMDKLTDEWRKIRLYQERGHVASYDDGLAHIEWRDVPLRVAA